MTRWLRPLLDAARWRCVGPCRRLCANSVSDSPDANQSHVRAPAVIPTTQQQFSDLLSAGAPAHHPDDRLLKIAIIGAPNSGKSTLVNRLIQWKVSSVSGKVHTTRSRVSGILSDVDTRTQLVFFDTPGLTTRDKMLKHRLEKSILNDPYSSMSSADLLAVVVDVWDKRTRGGLDKQVLTALMKYNNTKSVLVLNKIDLVPRKNELLALTALLTDGCVAGKAVASNVQPCGQLETELETDQQRAQRARVEAITEESRQRWLNVSLRDGYNDPKRVERRQLAELVERRCGWSRFQRVFMISALHNDGVVDLRNFLLTEALPARWLFPPTLVSDQSPYQLACDIVWEKLLDHLPFEIPYHVALTVDKWDLKNDSVFIQVVVLRRLRWIASDANRELSSALRQNVRLYLVANCPKSATPPSLRQPPAAEPQHRSATSPGTRAPKHAARST